MWNKGHSGLWNKKHSALIMVGASLLVMLLSIGLLSIYQQDQEMKQIRAQGLGLVKLLSGMSMEQLAPTDGKGGPIDILRYNESVSGFSYGIISNRNGLRVIQVSNSGIVPDQASKSPVNSGRNEIIEIKLPDNNLEIIEFRAPIIYDGKIQGLIRLGYLKPGFHLTSQQAQIFAVASLLIFILASVFYFLVKNRAAMPLKDLDEKLQALVDQQKLNGFELRPDGELSGFISNFDKFMQIMHERMENIEHENIELLTSTKLISFRKARVESILKSLPDGVMVLDEMDSVTYANNKVLDILDYTRDQVITKTPKEWCNDEKLLLIFRKINSKYSIGVKTDEMEYLPESNPGKYFNVRSYPLFSPTDRSEMFGTLVIFRDATTEHLAKKGRGEFVAHVAHEMKSPLNVLSMYSENLLEKVDTNDSETIDSLNIMHDEVERLTQLINNLLNITKIEMGSINLEKKRVRMHEFLGDIYSTIQHAKKSKSMDIVLDVSKKLSPVMIDKDLLRIAINNLLTNAIKYNHENGSVIIRAEENEHSIKIFIRDSGIGIPEEEEKHIFEKFYRGENSEVRERSGHGLGLSLAKDIVEAHNGSITLTSNVEEGSEFVIEFRKEAIHYDQAAGQ